MLAPAVGGMLAQYASWRWIFVVNVPLGIAGIVLARRLVPDLRPGAPRLDRLGFALTALGVGALLVAMENVGAAAVDMPVVVGGVLTAAALLGAAVAHLLRAPGARPPGPGSRAGRPRPAHPAVPSYRVTAAGGSVYRMVLTAVPFLLALFFQLGFGWSAARAGTVVIALFVGNVGIKPATTPLMRRFGIRAVLLGAIPASMACLLGIAALTRATPLPLLLACSP